MTNASVLTLLSRESRGRLSVACFCSTLPMLFPAEATTATATAAHMAPFYLWCIPAGLNPLHWSIHRSLAMIDFQILVTRGWLWSPKPTLHFLLPGEVTSWAKKLQAWEAKLTSCLDGFVVVMGP